MKFKFLYVLLLPFLLLNCQGQTAKPLQKVNEKVFSEKIETTQNPQLIDVRTPEEYAVEHLERAVNINWNAQDFVEKVQKLDQEKPIFVYCKIGGRSGQAANKLIELGFKEIYNLDGGIMKWTGKKTGNSDVKLTGMTNSEFDTILNSDVKVIVNFSAVWCTPCKKMTPYLIKMQKELEGKITLLRLDADENKMLMKSLKLDGLPVILIYENGKETWRNIGYITEKDLKKYL